MSYPSDFDYFNNLLPEERKIAPAHSENTVQQDLSDFDFFNNLLADLPSSSSSAAPVSAAPAVLDPDSFDAEAGEEDFDVSETQADHSSKIDANLDLGLIAGKLSSLISKGGCCKTNNCVSQLSPAIVLEHRAFVWSHRKESERTLAVIQLISNPSKRIVSVGNTDLHLCLQAFKFVYGISKEKLSSARSRLYDYRSVLLFFVPSVLICSLWLCPQS